jgi:hypothetical protein
MVAASVHEGSRRTFSGGRMSIRRGVGIAAAALVSALPAMMPAMMPAVAQAQRAGGGQPMSVKLLPPSPETNQPLRFVLNQPGYVAAFIISPGEGVRLIYPLVSQEKRQWAGFNTEPLFGVHFDDEAYDVVFGRSMYSAASFGVGYTGGPRYLYIVASRFPLDVSRFVHHPSELQRTIGYENARAFDSDYAIEGLLNNAVSLGSEDSWDTDVYMLWAPSWMDDAPHSFQEALYWNMGTRVVACRDGSSQVVPLNWLFRGCYGESRLLLSRPVTSATTTQRIASNVESPTVLPTIRGVRMARVPESKSEPTLSGFVTTAAGGVTSNGVRLIDPSDEPQRTVTYTTRGGSEVVVVERGESLREREDGGRDGWRRGRGEHGERRVEDETPRLAPAPRLAPDPVLAPAPRLAPAPNVGEARMSTPSIPRAEPRMEAPRIEAPRMTAPASAPVMSAPRAAPAPVAAPATPAGQAGKVQ